MCLDCRLAAFLYRLCLLLCSSLALAGLSLHANSLQNVVPGHVVLDSKNLQNPQEGQQSKTPPSSPSTFSPTFGDYTSKAPQSFFIGDPSVMPSQAIDYINGLSSDLYNQTGFSLYVHVLNESTLGNASDKSDKADSRQRFMDRRSYEDSFIATLDGNYAALFLFYKDHHLTLRSNASFIDPQALLERYAYPYLPVASIDSNDYNEGVNRGVSNAYLALVHAIGSHYGLDLGALPSPVSKPGDAARIIISLLLASLVGVFAYAYIRSRKKQ